MNYLKFLRYLAIAIPCLTSFSASSQVQHVVLISIDGFHPDMYTDSCWPSPNLRQLMKQGSYADHMLSVFPAYTYPAHTAMVTGAMPARSKVTYNQPLGSKGEWNWEAKYIKAKTLWQVLKENQKTTAAVMWPGSVDGDITYNLSEIWDVRHPDDRATEVRKHTAPPGLYEEIEQNATGRLDSTNMNDNYLSLDENAGRMAAYIFKRYKPNFLALHFACVDGAEHAFGRDADSVRLAVEANDRAIGELMEAITQSGLKENTTVLIVGDHGFSTIHTVFRPNMLITGLPVRFNAAGGSAFLYRTRNTTKMDEVSIIQSVEDSLNQLPDEKRKLFRVIGRRELNEMGVDSSAILALAAVPGTVFSNAISAAKSTNQGPGTLIQQNPFEGVFVPTKGGHHGYDPKLPDMWTGFIAYGAKIVKGGHISELRVTDVAPLVAKLLGIDFKTPDGKLPDGILTNN